MITDRRKNLLVGLVVLIGLVLLGWMILAFGGFVMAPFTNGRANVSVLTDRADGVGEGSAVLYRGMSVGQVRKVRLADDMASVMIELQLNGDARVPANVEAIIRPQGFIGGSSAVFLELTAPQAQGKLMAGSEIRGRVGRLDMLPKEFTDLADDLKKTSQSFRESKVIEHLDEAIVNISKQASKAGEVLESVNGLVADPKMRKDLQEAMANVNEATAVARKVAGNLESFSGSLEKTGGNLDRLTSEAGEAVKDARVTIKTSQKNIDEITKQVADRLTQTASLLESMNSVARKVDQGKGTAGMMVNDAKLYEALVDSAKQLNITLTDLKRLVQQWEQEGVTLRVN